MASPHLRGVFLPGGAEQLEKEQSVTARVTDTAGFCPKKGPLRLASRHTLTLRFLFSEFGALLTWVFCLSTRYCQTILDPQKTAISSRGLMRLFFKEQAFIWTLKIIYVHTRIQQKQKTSLRFPFYVTAEGTCRRDHGLILHPKALGSLMPG